MKNTDLVIKMLVNKQSQAENGSYILSLLMKCEESKNFDYTIEVATTRIAQDVTSAPDMVHSFKGIIFAFPERFDLIYRKSLTSLDNTRTNLLASQYISSFCIAWMEAFVFVIEAKQMSAKEAEKFIMNLAMFLTTDTRAYDVRFMEEKLSGMLANAVSGFLNALYSMQRDAKKDILSLFFSKMSSEYSKVKENMNHTNVKYHIMDQLCTKRIINYTLENKLGSILK